MLLDTSGFAAGINTSVAMLGVFQRAQAQAFAPNGPKLNTAQFQAEINGLNQANQTLQNSLRQTAAAEQPVAAGLNGITSAGGQTAAQNVRLSGSFQNVGLSLMSLQAGLAQLNQIKAVVMDLIGEANKLQATNLGLENVAKFKGIPREEIQQSIQQLDIVRNGILSYGEAAQTVSNFLRGGMNLPDAIKFLQLFTDAAVFGRQATLDLGYAVVSGSEGWRINNNMLLDNMGMTTNLSVLNKRAGLSQEELDNKMNDGTVIARQLTEMEKELAISKGNAAQYSDTFAGSESKLNTQLTVGKQKVGELLQEGYGPMLGDLTGLIDNTGKFVDKLGEVTKTTPGTADGIKKIAIEMTAMNLLAPGLGFISTEFHAIQDAVRDAGNEFGIFVNQLLMIKGYTGLFGFLNQKDYAPPVPGEMGPELPPGFKRVGKGGDVPGHDIAGESTFSTKKSRGRGSNSSVQEITNDVINLEKQIKNLQDSQNITDPKSILFAHYTIQINELLEKIAFLKSDISIIKNIPDAVNIPNTSNAPGLERIRLSEQESMMMHAGKTKEQTAADKFQVKDWMANTQQFSSALGSLSQTLGLTNTAFGKTIDFLSGFSNTISSIMQLVNSFGGSSGIGGIFSLLGTIGGFALGGPVGAAVGGTLGGGGGFGGSLRNYNGGYQGNVNQAVSSQSQRVVERIIIPDFTGDGEKLRIMFKDIDYKRGKISTNK